jgi:hypothetical protein
MHKISSKESVYNAGNNRTGRWNNKKHFGTVVLEVREGVIDEMRERVRKGLNGLNG